MLHLRPIVLTSLVISAVCQWFPDYDYDRVAWYRGGASTDLGRWIMGGRGRGRGRDPRARVRQYRPDGRNMGDQGVRRSDQVKMSDEDVWSSDQDDLMSNQVSLRPNPNSLSSDVPPPVDRSQSGVPESGQDLPPTILPRTGVGSQSEQSLKKTQTGELLVALEKAKKGLWVRKLSNEDGSDDFVIMKGDNRNRV